MSCELWGNKTNICRRVIISFTIHVSPKGLGDFTVMRNSLLTVLARCFTEWFDSLCRCVRCDGVGEMRQQLKELMPEYQQDFGVLLYLYSLLLTKVL